MRAFELSWPLIVVDFEATALSTDGYPIEVGMAIAISANSPIETWSTLIKPDPCWLIDDQWDPDAERVHKISRWSLRHGLPPAEALRELNSRVPSGAAVWCDGGYYDAAWLATLAQAADCKPAFELRDLIQAISTDFQLQRRFREVRSSDAKPHRAGPDARRLLDDLMAACQC